MYPASKGALSTDSLAGRERERRQKTERERVWYRSVTIHRERNSDDNSGYVPCCVINRTPLFDYVRVGLFVFAVVCL